MIIRVGPLERIVLSLRILRSISSNFIVLVDLIRWRLVLNCWLGLIYDAFLNVLRHVIGCRLCFFVIGDQFRGGFLGHARLPFVEINHAGLKLCRNKQRVDVRVARKRSIKPQQAWATLSFSVLVVICSWIEALFDGVQNVLLLFFSQLIFICIQKHVIYLFDGSLCGTFNFSV